MKTALTIAGSDSSGGAGIQADLKTMLANGVYGMSVITALTAQNTVGVYDIMEVSRDFLIKQMDAVFTDIYPDAVKVGMVKNTQIIEAIAERLNYYKAVNIVIDPVMVSTSEAKLIEDSAIESMKKYLFPLADIITPNIPEAEVLSGMDILGTGDMEKAAGIIGEKYGTAVILKGGHCINDADDVLYSEGKIRWYRGEKIDNPNTHGTGCTLSSAIASWLARGYGLEESVGMAKKYISEALSSMLNLGRGQGPLNHGFMIEPAGPRIHD